jgi:uncharacterized protein (DUF488 family)
MASLCTIGFAGKSAERFFTLLAAAGVRRVIDTRLRPDSQLSGFAKRADLAFLLARLGPIEYRHHPRFAPTAAMLADYRAGRLDWDGYAAAYRALIAERGIEGDLPPDQLDGACLLCSEHLPHRCHRRLLAEHLRRAVPGLRVMHLVELSDAAG